jgi:hypothetical protein
MPVTLHVLFLLIAAILFFIGAFVAWLTPTPRFNLLSAGLFFTVLGLLFT